METSATTIGSPSLNLTRSLTLFFSVPEILATLPRLPWPSAQSRIYIPRVLRSQVIPRALLLGLSSLTSFLPPPVVSVMSSVLLIVTLVSIYITPALLHILFHNLFRPTSIIIPSGQLGSITGLLSNSGDGDGADEEGARRLLFAKERKMQRRRLLRRLLWDVAVWVLVVGAGVWVVGKIARWWWWM